MKEEFVNLEEIWVICNPEDAHGVTIDGKSMKKIAILANGYPIYLEPDAYLETTKITKEQSRNLIKKTLKSKS